MRHKKILSRKSTLNQYSKRTYIKSGDGKGNGNGSAPPPPTTCPIDIVIGVDLSGSAGGPMGGGAWPYGWQGMPNMAYEAERKLLEELIDNLTPFMDSGLVQVGIVFWSSTNPPPISVDPNGFSMSSWTKNTHPGSDLDTSPILQDPVGNMVSPLALIMRNANVAISSGTSLNTALDSTMAVLQLKSTSEFASQYPARENDPDFSQIGIIVTDSTGFSAGYSGCQYQSSLLLPNPNFTNAMGSSPVGPDNQFVIGCTVRPNSFPISNTAFPPGLYGNVRNTLDALTCGQNSGPNDWNTSLGYGNFGFYINTLASVGSSQHISTIGTKITQEACNPIVEDTWSCSEASGAVDSAGSFILPWNCYDPLDGSGQYTDANSGGNPGDGLATCNTNCVEPSTWECSGPSGFVSTNPLVGTVPQWTCYDPLDGSGSHGFGPLGLSLCTMVCNPPPPTYSCSGPFGVSLADWTPLHPTYGMNIPPWKCFDTGMGTGQFTGINALTLCEAACVEPSWDCNPTTINCDPNTTGSGYWNSTNGGLQGCEAVCLSTTWKCHIPWQSTVGTCTSGLYSPPEHATEQLCLDVCKEHYIDIGLTGDVSWNCEWTWVGYPTSGLVGNCNSVTGSSGTYAIEQDCLDACKEGVIGETHADSWDCHIPWKQTVGHCHLKTDGTGAYSLEQDCIDACVDLEIFIDTGLTADLCDDIIACPCGWEYAGVWGFPNPVANPLPGYVHQGGDNHHPDYYVNPGEKWCKHPDWDWFYDPANSSHINAILAQGANNLCPNPPCDPPPLALPAQVFPCAETLGLPSAYVGMSVGSGTGSNGYSYPPLPYGIPPTAGRQFNWSHSVAWPFDQAPSYVTPAPNQYGILGWENYTVVEISPGSPAPSLPYLQNGWQAIAEPSTPCTAGGVPHTPGPTLCEETLACPCGFTPVQASWATWGWTCEWTENTPGGPYTVKLNPYKIDCQVLGQHLPLTQTNHVLPSNAGGVPSYCLDQWSLMNVNGLYGGVGLPTSYDIPNATTGQYFKTITWDKARIFDIQPASSTLSGQCTTLACITNHIGQIGTAPWGTIPVGCNYILSKNTSASGCSQPC